jgi:molybdopterin-guanine dinucleotide biosynthesis protein A
VIEGRTILDRQLDVLSRAADEVFVVGNAPPRPASRSSPIAFQDAGPIGVFIPPSPRHRARIVLVVACDMPFVTAELLACLARLCADAEAVVPRTERGYHPVCAAYRRTCLERVARRVSNGQLKMAELLAEIAPRIVSADDMAQFGDPDRLLANVNTPADYGNLEALHSQEL